MCEYSKWAEHVKDEASDRTLGYLLRFASFN